MNKSPDCQIGEKPGSLFSQPWWLDAVAENRWDCVEIEKGGKLAARLPYVWNPHSRHRFHMPLLTQTLGPWLDLGTGKLAKRLSRHKELTEALITKLPPFHQFKQNFHYSIDNWLPWYWAGFKQTTRYTYVLDDLTNLDQTWDGFASNIKREIRKAEKQVEIETLDSPDEFFRLNEMVFQRQNKKLPYTREFVEKLDDACRHRGQRKIFLARGADGQTHAGCYIVWDANSAYYLMGGGNPELRRSGATSLCMWNAIQFAATVSEKFDFEGSMIEPIERFFRSFGATPRPFSSISKDNVSPLRHFAFRVHSKLRRSLFHH